MTLSSTSIQAEFSSTFVDEWVRAGVRHAVISPGSRSSSIAIALLSDRRIDVVMRLDERSAAFFALGIALSTKTPVIMLTTSGTAATEVHAAVVEADLARVPLIIVTADRPVELHDVHAPQTIDQSHLFAGCLRYHLDLPVPTAETRDHWRSFASRLVAESSHGAKGAGPVHANIAFREPIVGEVGVLPPGRRDGSPWHQVIRGDEMSAMVTASVLDLFVSAQRAVVIVGGEALADPSLVLGYAQRRGWPVLGDARAIGRSPHPVLISHADQFLRSDPIVQALRPELVVHVGMPHASKTLTGWNAGWSSAEIPHLFVDQFGGFADPERIGTIFLATSPERLFRDLTDHVAAVAGVDPDWLGVWRRCDDAAGRAIAQALDNRSLTEPAVARTLFRALGEQDTLFCSSSMPVRDVEWFAAPRQAPPRVLANRGANGIDGVVSSVLGVARASSGRTVGLVGDLAFLHDLSGLVWGSNEEVPAATIVVIDNQGGGIFSFLDYPTALEGATFERGFGTPQRNSIFEVASSLGCSVLRADSADSLAMTLEQTDAQPGISVVVVSTDRDENVRVHQELARASTEAALAVL